MSYVILDQLIDKTKKTYRCGPCSECKGHNNGATEVKKIPGVGEGVHYRDPQYLKIGKHPMQ